MALLEEEELVFIAKQQRDGVDEQKHPYTPDYSETRILIQSICMGCVCTNLLQFCRWFDLKLVGWRECEI